MTGQSDGCIQVCDEEIAGWDLEEKQNEKFF